MAYAPRPFDRVQDAAGALDGLMGLVSDRKDLNVVSPDGLYCLLGLIHRELTEGLAALEAEAIERRRASA